MKKSTLLIALLFFGISFGKTHDRVPLPKVLFTSLTMGASSAVSDQLRTVYDKGGSDTCSSGINLGITLELSTGTIDPGKTYLNYVGTSNHWTGATSTYYRLVGTTNTATVSIDSTGLITYLACGN